MCVTDSIIGVVLARRRVAFQQRITGSHARYPNGSVFNTYQWAPGPDRAHQHYGPAMRQYFIDWRNADAAMYFVDAIVNTTLADGVDATFTDDLPGVPQEHPEVRNATQLSDKVSSLCCSVGALFVFAFVFVCVCGGCENDGLGSKLPIYPAERARGLRIACACVRACVCAWGGASR